MESISEKLKSLGVKRGLVKSSNLDLHPKRLIHEVVPGEYRDHPHGRVFIHEDIYPVEYTHGRVKLSELKNGNLISRWAKTLSLDGKNSNTLVFIDTETTSLSGGAGTFVFMMGIGFQTTGGFTVRQFFLESPSDETAFLAEIESQVGGFSGLVSFNGKSFDIPMLNSRFTINNLPSPFSGYPHIDLLPLARRLWKYRLPRRNLGTLEMEILGFRRSQDEIPGWMVPEIYIDYLRNQNPSPLAGVFYHNAVDILSLAALYFHLSDLLQTCDPNSIDEGLDMMALGNLYRDLKNYDLAIILYENSLHKKLPQDFYITTMLEYAQICKRNGNYDQACDLWKKAEMKKDLTSSEELSKYYEHHEKNYHLAKQHIIVALRNLTESDFTKKNRNEWQISLSSRLKRIEKKMTEG